MADAAFDNQATELEIPCSEHEKLNKDGSCKGQPQCPAGLARKLARKAQVKARSSELRAEKRGAAKVAKTALRFTPSSGSRTGALDLSQANFDAR
jgi:hypothetical protein